MTKGLEDMERLAQQTNFELIEDIASGPSIDPYVRGPAVQGPLIDTVKRKVELEHAVRGDEVPREEVIRWVHELAAHIIDPSQPLLSWNLPEPSDIGEGWNYAAINAIQNVRQRLSDDHWKAQIREAYRKRRANPPGEPELTEAERLIIEHAEELSADERNEAG